MDENVKCPNCESKNFVTDDYEEEIIDDGVINFSWRCRCKKCKNIFHVIERYARKDTYVLYD